MQREAGVQPISEQLSNLSKSEKAFRIFQAYQFIAQDSKKKSEEHKFFFAVTKSTHFTASQLVRGAAQVDVRGSLQPECKVYSKWDIYDYNQFVWALAYILLGIQFTHADQGIM